MSSFEFYSKRNTVDQFSRPSEIRMNCILVSSAAQSDLLTAWSTLGSGMTTIDYAIEENSDWIIVHEMTVGGWKMVHRQSA